MAHTLIGTLEGNVIKLDTIGRETPTAASRPQRVRVAVEPLDDADLKLSPEQNAELLREWAEHGPQGPINSEGDG